MSKLDKILIEALLFKKDTPPNKKNNREMTVKQMIKLMKQLPEFKREFHDALKHLEDKKEEKKEKLSTIHKYMLWTLGAFLGVPTYIFVMGLLFNVLRH